jgi:hypothetical protein
MAEAPFVLRLWREKSADDDFNFSYETCSKRRASLPSPATIPASAIAINHAQIHRSTNHLAALQRNARFLSLHFLAMKAVAFICAAFRRASEEQRQHPEKEKSTHAKNYP